MSERSPLRDRLLGVPEDNDRLWLLHLPNGETHAITDYNDELTGYAPELAVIDPKVFHYGGNAYYITGTYARLRGWTVTEHEDRFPDRSSPTVSSDGGGTRG